MNLDPNKIILIYKQKLADAQAENVIEQAKAMQLSEELEELRASYNVVISQLEEANNTIKTLETYEKSINLEN